MYFLARYFMSKKFFYFIASFVLVFTVSGLYQPTKPVEAACYTITNAYGWYNNAPTTQVYVGPSRYMVVTGTFTKAQIDGATITLAGAPAKIVSKVAGQLNIDVSSISVGSKTLSISDPACTATKSINFQTPPPASFVVTPKTNPTTGAKGTISPSTPQNVTAGATTSFTITPNAGYTIAVGGTCGGTLAGNTYVTRAVTANCDVIASFNAVAPVYTVSLNVTNEPSGGFCIYTNGTPNDKPRYKVQGSSNLANIGFVWSSTRNGVSTGEENASYGNTLNSSAYWEGEALPLPSLAGAWTKTVRVFRSDGSASSLAVPFTVRDCTPKPMTGTLTSSAPSCVIPDGASTCSVNLTWATQNPESTSTVTSSYPAQNTTVFNGNNGGPSAVQIPSPGRKFFLYNNQKSLVPTPPNGSGIEVKASCALGSDYVANVCRAKLSIVATQSPNGTITPPDTTKVTYGSSQTYTITPASGYIVESLTIDGQSKPAQTSYTFSNVTSNHSISAKFKASACPNGAINPPACDKCVEGSVMIGGKCTPVAVTVTATTPYTSVPGSTVSINYDPKINTTNTGVGTECLLVDINKNELPPKTYKVSTASNNSLSYTLPNVLNSYTVYVKCRSIAVNSATAFSNAVAVNAACPAGSDFVSGSCKVKPKITTIQALNGTIDPPGVASILYGSNKVYTITPAAGYNISSILVDGKPEKGSTSYTFLGVVSDRTISATFAANACPNGAINPPKCDQCPVGQALIGGKCTPVAIPSGTINASSCNINPGESTCYSTIDWKTQNLIPGKTVEVTKNNPDNTHVSWLASSTGMNVSVRYGDTTFFIYHDGKKLAESSMKSSCSGTNVIWDGTKCVVNAPGPGPGPGPGVVNGKCATPPNGGTYPSVPVGKLCDSGVTAPPILSGPGPWTWICRGSGGGSTANCSANTSVSSGNCPVNATPRFIDQNGRVTDFTYYPAATGRVVKVLPPVGFSGGGTFDSSNKVSAVILPGNIIEPKSSNTTTNISGTGFNYNLNGVTASGCNLAPATFRVLKNPNRQDV